jgi:SDR family mycofactocin-dependent oxidoreductase
MESRTMGRVEGKVALITGAARGQGRSHAIRLAEEGANIIAVDICAEVSGTQYPAATEADLRETVRKVESLGRRVISSEVDVRDFEALRLAVDVAVAELGHLDIVSANAGITSVAAPSHILSEEQWQDMIDINLTGVWHTAKVSIPHLILNEGGGSVVLTSSVAGLKAYDSLSHYVTAKHGVVGLMRALALELAPHRIRVNSLHPTQVNTPMIMNDATFKLFLPHSTSRSLEEFSEASRSMHALPAPWIESIDVSNALLFLASEEARYITGVALPVDAGSGLR